MQANSSAPVATHAGDRDQILDMVKGLLVVGMLMIHASNLFVESDDMRSLVYPTWLGFVSGSWLWISGYIIGLQYRRRFLDSRGTVTRRLFGRGWRLIAIFLVSNIVLGNISLIRCFGHGEPDRCNLVQILILGDEAQAFEVLLGIGYLLLVSTACLRVPVNILAGLTLCMLVGLSALQAVGFELPLLSWMLACGIAGIVIGSLADPQKIHRVMDVTWSRTLATVLAVLIWCNTEMLFVFGIVSGNSPAFYVPHVISALWMLYGVGTWISTINWLSRPLAVLAHYSLLAYMAQMAILRTWRYLVADLPVANTFAVSVLVAFFLLLGSAYLLSALRRRFYVVDRIYLTVFG